MADRAVVIEEPGSKLGVPAEGTLTGLPDELSALCDEIRDQHRFFVEWYNGRELGPGAFENFEHSLDAGFRMITPTGRMLERGDVITFVRANRGTEDGGFDIEIADVSMRARGADLVVVAYKEIQNRKGQETIRLSSAVFRPEP